MKKVRLKPGADLPPRIGVMRDRVFTFYYPENLEALRRPGGLCSSILSAMDCRPSMALYRGGFPEFFLDELERNRGLREDIARSVEDNMPVYAECAGLMYLCRKIRWRGRSYEMAGVIPAEVDLEARPQGMDTCWPKSRVKIRSFRKGRCCAAMNSITQD